MPFSIKPSWSGSDYDMTEHGSSTLPRRIRHITSIQIRNLTPFPVRDALASALTKPSEQPQFTAYGHLSDDLDVTVGRKRGRRVSNASSLHSGPRGDEDGLPMGLDRSSEPTMRRRTSSRASIALSSSAGSSSPSLTRRPSSAAIAPVTRPGHRSRTLSSHSLHASSSSALTANLGTSTSSIFPDLLRDTSQKRLESVLKSRLVETFITVSLLSAALEGEDSHPSTPNGERTDFQRPYHPPSRPSSPSQLVKDKVKGTATKTMPRRGTVGATPARSPTTPSRHGASASVSSAKIPFAGHVKTASVSTNNGRLPKSPLTPPSQKSRFPSPGSHPRPTAVSSAPEDPQTSAASIDSLLRVPDYISSIHWPSTNPIFQLSRYEFAPGTDLSGATMRVEVWGRASQEGRSQFKHSDGIGKSSTMSPDAKGKGKEKQMDDLDGDSDWRVLETWDVSLSDLPPLPQELAANPAHIPSNTLLITLSTGQTIYLPPRSLRSNAPSRAPSPNAGYNSDPEGEAHRVRGNNGDLGLQSPTLGSLDSMPTSPTISELDGTHRRKRAVKSATWQDLLKVINLQTVILDTEQSLGEVVRQIDKVVVHNEANILLREVSEREAWLAELRDERTTVGRDSESLREQIMARREDLRRRREILEQARQLHDQDMEEEVRVEETISEERIRLASLRNLIPIMRSNLISIVSFIYPIELVSPPDLLFSILDVSLPIPIAATDPAPPLTLPAYKEVTEDSVATALGFSAQVVQLLSAYMGHRLVYPVTCVGSRSMIKDGISAMVGPRNFPLFSKGVDTYRFEYGVFLLNKDIEMLMGERNLRALDMRHTLPNLKNLLLTLTDNVQRSIPGHRSTSSSVSISSLQSQSPVPVNSSLSPESKQGTNAAVHVPESIDKEPTDVSATVSASGSASESGTGADTSSTPPASGTTTPTKATQRKTRPFLDLAPLTGFLTLRGRYTASQKPSVKSVAETPDSEAQASADGASAANGSAAQAASSEGGAEDALGDTGDDEDDRRTIRGVRSGGTVNGEDEGGADEDDALVEGKTAVAAANGDVRVASRGKSANGREKVADGAVPQSQSLLLSS